MRGGSRQCDGRSVVLVVLSLAACGSEKVDAVATEPVAEAPVEPPAEAPAAPSIYDENGLLKSSEDLVAGLPLPMGTTLEASEERWHNYASPASVPELRAFFAQQLDTGSVKEVGPAVIYERAIPRAARGAAVRLTVSLFPAGRNRSRIEVREIPMPSKNPEKTLSQEEVMRIVQERQRLLD